MAENEYFITPENVGMLKLAKEANTILVGTHFFLFNKKENKLRMFLSGLRRSLTIGFQRLDTIVAVWGRKVRCR